jgi:hypothetical protein
LHQPAYAALSPRDKARAIWPYALASASRTAGLFGRRVALPSFGNDPELAGALLQHALCSGQAALAGGLLAGDEGRLAGAFGPSAAGCPRIEGSVSPDKLPARHWQDIEQRLGQPVLPWLAIQAATPARAAGLLAAGLRSPWGEPAALGLYVRHALRAPAGVALLRAVPPGALRSALHDDAILAEWLAASADWPQADLDWALAQVAPARLAGQLESCSSAGDIPASPAGTPGIAPIVWPAGRPHRPPRRALAAGRRAPFLYVVPSELWPRWFALGYRPADRQWADWLTGLEPANLERVWPLIARHQPEIARRRRHGWWRPCRWAHRRSRGPAPELPRPVSPRPGFSRQGAPPRRPRGPGRAAPLAGRRVCAGKPAPGVALALAQGWVKPAPAALRRQVEPAPLACSPGLAPGCAGRWPCPGS